MTRPPPSRSPQLGSWDHPGIDERLPLEMASEYVALPVGSSIRDERRQR